MLDKAWPGWFYHRHWGRRLPCTSFLQQGWLCLRSEQEKHFSLLKTVWLLAIVPAPQFFCVCSCHLPAYAQQASLLPWQCVRRCAEQSTSFPGGSSHRNHCQMRLFLCGLGDGPRVSAQGCRASYLPGALEEQSKSVKRREKLNRI